MNIISLEDIFILKRGIESVRTLMDDSVGVVGLHLNDEIASWASLEKRGRFEEWLKLFSDAEYCIAKIYDDCEPEPEEIKGNKRTEALSNTQKLLMLTDACSDALMGGERGWESMDFKEFVSACRKTINAKRVLQDQLNNQLNDCINFDGGKLTDSVMKESSDLLKRIK